MILVYITTSGIREAKKIAKHLLKKKLIACANIIPIESLYSWEKKLVDEKEVVLLAKTKEQHYSRTVSEVERIHSYSVPCILKIPMKANAKYEEWMKKELL